MSVAHILPHIFEDISYEKMSSSGGAERFAFGLAMSMSKIVDTKLIIFGKMRQSVRHYNLDIEIYPAVSYLRFINGNSNPISIKFLQEIDSSNIVHIHQSRNDVSLISAIYSKLKGKIVLITDHGWNGACIGRLKIIERIVDGFLPDSRFDGKFLKKYGKYIMPIYAGVDTQKFCPPEGPKKSNRVLFVGRILPHKGINYLIDAIDKDMELHIVGHSLNKNYLEYLKSISSEKNIKFLLSPSDQDIIKEYQDATVSILPSVYNDIYGKYHPKPELFGLVLIEAMACETPVICANVGGMPEVVDNGITGFIIPPNDSYILNKKIRYFIENPDMVKKMGKNARQKVLMNFTWDKVTERCLSAYNHFR